MNFKASGVAVAALLLATVAAHSQEPVENVDPNRHGNLATAQEMVRAAYDKLSEAQMANDAQLGGHASRAKELLQQANEEIKQAALAANRR
jgi:hypothetical protein